MPEINKITEVLYDGNQPYHVHYDNLPLKNILTRIDLVNAQVDINSEILRGSCGSVGTLNNRLAASLEEDGKLKKEAVDFSLHNIGAHEDGAYDGIEYVRMKKSERDKLDLIQSESNKIQFEIEDNITYQNAEYVTVTDGLMKLRSSDSVNLQFTAPNILSFHSVFSPELAHIHNYQIVPANKNPSSPDYRRFITTAINTPFRQGSLRVYINGIRINNSNYDQVNVSMQSSDDTFILNSHGLPNGTPISFTSIENNNDLQTYTTYYVINATTNTFKLSNVTNGSSINLQTDGSGVMVRPSELSTKVYIGGDPDVVWDSVYVESQDETNGDFALNKALTSEDVIFIDFDQQIS